MARSDPTWSVVLTVKEPPALVLANVGWHLAAGAEAVHVYLDWPDDPVAEALKAIPGVRVVRCHAAYWKRHHDWKVMPRLQTFRQSLNATHAYGETGSDWLLHLDADEFLVQRPSVLPELRMFPDSDAYLRLAVEERVFLRGTPPQSIFSGLFRVGVSKPPPVYNAFWGSAAPFIRHGLTAHIAGKAFARTGLNLGIGVHRTFRGKRLEDDRPDAVTSHGARLLHFDGMTPLHWAIKRIRYAEADTRTREQLIGGGQVPQVDEVRQTCATLDDVLRLQDTVQAVDPGQTEQLSAFGLLNMAAFDPTDALREVLGDAVPDLSAAAFDAELRARNEALLQRWDAEAG